MDTLILRKIVKFVIMANMRFPPGKHDKHVMSTWLSNLHPGPMLSSAPGLKGEDSKGWSAKGFLRMSSKGL